MQPNSDGRKYSAIHPMSEYTTEYKFSNIINEFTVNLGYKMRNCKIENWRVKIEKFEFRNFEDKIFSFAELKKLCVEENMNHKRTNGRTTERKSWIMINHDSWILNSWLFWGLANGKWHSASSTPINHHPLSILAWEMGLWQSAIGDIFWTKYKIGFVWTLQNN